MFLDHIDHQLAETILRHLQASDASLRVAQLRVLGGAMARMHPEATAFAHRGSAIMANVASFYDGPADKPVRQRWVDQVSAALHQSDDGAYVGFLTTKTPHASACLPGIHLEPARADQGTLRPHQPVPPQPQHPDSNQCARAVKVEALAGSSVP